MQTGSSRAGSLLWLVDGRSCNPVCRVGVRTRRRRRQAYDSDLQWNERSRIACTRTSASAFAATSPSARSEGMGRVGGGGAGARQQSRAEATALCGAVRPTVPRRELAIFLTRPRRGSLAGVGAAQPLHNVLRRKPGVAARTLGRLRGDRFPSFRASPCGREARGERGAAQRMHGRNAV